MMNRGYLALGAALVVVVVIALYVAIASSDDDELTAVPRGPHAERERHT
jgi:flagellar biosynthesis protein FliQ